MKILFIGLKVGAGLISICNSVKSQLEKEKDVECRYFDIYENNLKMAHFSSDFYYKIVRIAPRIVTFGQTFAYNSALRSKSGHYYLNNDVEESKKELLKYLENYKPDIIFTSVNFVAVAIDELLEEKKIDLKYFFQIPDFAVAYYSQILKHCTYIFSPCEEVTNILLNKGVSENVLKTVGIPVNEKFDAQIDREETIKELGLDGDKFILVSNGGVGFANNYRIAKRLNNSIGDYKLIIVNGKNEKSKNKLDEYIKKHNIKNIINLGFVDYMPKLMKISDIMIGKCGSSTLCEASKCNLNYIAFNNKLFPEVKNIEFLKKRNCALVASNVRQIKKALAYYMNNPNSEIRKNFQNINIKDNLKIIKNLILN